VTTVRRPGITIERLRPGDYEAVVELAADVGSRYRCSASDPETRRVFDLYVAGDGKDGVVARADGEVVGVYLYDLAPMFAPTHLHGRGDLMAVAKPHRGRGIATTMMAEAWRMAKEQGVTSFLAKSSVPEMIEWFRSIDELTERGSYFYYDPDPSLLEER
jgi:GNAT superfamily N-acetyltransferase